MYLAITKVENNRCAKVIKANTASLLNDALDKHFKDGKTVREFFPDLVIYDNSANTPDRDLWIEDGFVTVVTFVEPVPTVNVRDEALEELLMEGAGDKCKIYQDEKDKDK